MYGDAGGFKGRLPNERIVEVVANEAYDRELRGEAKQRVWVCRKAAWVIEDTEQDVRLLYRSVRGTG